MPINQTYDETAGHRVIVATMAEARPLLRAAALGAYVELVSVQQRNVKASLEQGIAPDAIDTRISLGDLIAIEPWEFQALAAAMVKHHLLTEPDQEGKYRLVEHPKLVGWDTPQQVWWEKERRKDNRDPLLELAVRHRDGDQCRVCHKIVRWGTSKSDPDGGTLDHVDPRTPAKGDPGALAVACRTCNGIRSDRRDADEFAPHQPAPAHPFYTAGTVAYLKRKDITEYPDGTQILKPTGRRWLLPAISITPRPRNQRDTAQQPAAPARPAPAADTAPTECDPATSGTPHHAEPLENPSRTPEVGETNSRSGTTVPAGRPPDDPGGLPRGEGKGREGPGSVPGTGSGRARSRRGRRSRSHSSKPKEQS